MQHLVGIDQPAAAGREIQRGVRGRLLIARVALGGIVQGQHHFVIGGALALRHAEFFIGPALAGEMRPEAGCEFRGEIRERLAHFPMARACPAGGRHIGEEAQNAAAILHRPRRKGIDMQQPVVLDHRIGPAFDFDRTIGCARPLGARIIGQQVLDEARRVRAEALDHRRQPRRPLAGRRSALQPAAGVVQADILGLAVGQAAIEKFRLAVGKHKGHFGEIEQLAMLQRRLRAGPRLRLERAMPLRDVEFLADHAPAPA